MKPKELASYLAKLEAGKSDGKIADKRQDVSNLSDLVFKEAEPVSEPSSGKIIGLISPTLVELYKNGQRRAARRKKARK